MDSRKSSASSTHSSSRISNSSKKKLPPLPSKPTSSLASTSDSNLNSNSKKFSYLNDANEKTINEEKSLRRYEMMMQKLEEINLMNEKIKDLEMKKKTIPSIKPSSPSNKSKANAVASTSGLQNGSNEKNEFISHTFLDNTNNTFKNHSPKNSNEITEKANKKISDDDDSNDGSDNDDDDDDDDRKIKNGIRNQVKAPNELLEEFLIYVMEKRWQDAHKLCKFILMYEANNKTAKEFLPLIEQKLEETQNGEENNDDDNDDEDEDESTDDEDDSTDDDDDTDDTDDDTDDDTVSSHDTEDENVVESKNARKQLKKLNEKNDDDGVQIVSNKKK